MGRDVATPNGPLPEGPLDLPAVLRVAPLLLVVLQPRAERMAHITGICRFNLSF